LKMHESNKFMKTSNIPKAKSVERPQTIHPDMMSEEISAKE